MTQKYDVKRFEELKSMKVSGGALLKLISKGLNAEYIAMSMTELKPGERVAHHRHEKAEEIYLLIKGRSQVLVDEERFDVEAFTALRFPAETMRSVYNNSDKNATWIFVGAPIDEFQEAYTEEQT